MICALVVDDERPALEKTARLLGESGMVEVQGRFTSPLEALDFLKKTPVDAAFLDIEMPGMDGLELANRALDLQGGLAVVFVTAYHEYAVEAFRLNALDYLLKPVGKERLRETLNRIVRRKNIQIRPAPVQVYCFGRFRVVAGGGEVKFRTGKAEELLAFLVDRRGAAAGRNEIIDRLWEDFEGDRAVAHFHTTLHYLKKALLQRGARAPVEHARGAYRLDPAGFDCDYHQFMSFVSAAKGVNAVTIREYEEAAALYAGDYLAGGEFRWAERNRVALREKYVRLILDLADYYRSAGEPGKTAEIMKTGLRHEPLHAGINYRLLEALLLLNDRVAAARYYDIYKRQLKNELGLEPGAEFRRLLR